MNHTTIIPMDSLAGTPIEWGTPPPQLNLDSQEIHVWRGILDRSSSELQAFWETLNPVEKHRARRFLSPQHQNRFIAAHGMVRHILALYANAPPPSLRFDKGPYGKPLLAYPTGTGLSFNLSHSHHLAILAVTLLGEIGVDLEHNRPTLNYRAIADRIMSEEEKSQFRVLPAHRQQSAFFRCWTRKEAFVKAHGRGLGFPLHEFSVGFTPHDHPRMVTIKDQNHDGRQWSMYTLFPGHEYTAALAVEGLPSARRYWHFSGGHHTLS